MQYSSFLRDVIAVADEASKKVLQIYRSEFEVEYKDDFSPITAADMASHDIIMRGLRKISHDIPILSEEGAEIPWEERRHWRRFWLVDPVDGTREFTERTGEFTVNIALIEGGVPVMGVVTAPALMEAYWGIPGEGAYKRDRTGKVARISVVASRPVKRVLASKSHLNEQTREFIDKLGDYELVQAGSSLKFCRIAEGCADIYPRLGPTSEWDTAAAHAVLVAAGGEVETLGREPLRYGKENVLNPYFVASGCRY